MAANAVDEAFRAHIALGGDPELTAALDNFCWPDPVASPSNPDGAYKLAQLVRASAGLKDTCLAYGIPLISGKDSMKNDAFSGNKKISIKPTLLISLMGIIKDLRFALTTDFKCPGHIIYLLGETKNECGGSILERVMGRPLGACPEVNPTRALSLYRALHRAIRAGLVRSCHDCAEGGLLAAAVESAIGGRYGFSLLLDNLPGEQARDAEDAVLLFAESASRFIVSIDEKDEKKFQKLFRNLPAARLGQVTEEAGLSIRHRGKKILDSSLERALAAWKGTLR
jgi:phosphoribosylformylglycinamidine synthase